MSEAQLPPEDELARLRWAAATVVVLVLALLAGLYLIARSIPDL